MKFVSVKKNTLMKLLASVDLEGDKDKYKRAKTLT